MHLYLYIRGVFTQVEAWKISANSQFWQWKRKNLKTGLEEMMLVQGALRPSVLGAWEYVFPEESLAEVLAFFGIAENGIGAEPSFSNKFKLAGLRKIFGAEKITKKMFADARKIPTSIMVKGTTRGLSHIVGKVSTHPIGIKRDNRGVLHNIIKDEKEVYFKEGYEQEML